MTTLAAHEDRPVLPPDDTKALQDLARLLETPDTVARLVGPNGVGVPLPAPVHDVLVQVVNAMRAGRAITVAPLALRLTTQEAADFLGVSRPTLVKILESGAIPYEQPGRHRRVRLVDVLNYRDARRSERRATLDRLTSDSVAAGVYDGTPEDYAAALKAARKQRES